MVPRYYTLKIVHNFSRSQRRSLGKYDWIGPPDVYSNIPTIKFKPTQNPLELELQSIRKQVWRLNHTFWSNHNRNFQQQKKKFISQKILQGNVRTQKVTTQELSQFYKEFLDSKYQEHMSYNWDWLKLQSKLTLVTLKIHLKQVLKQIV